MSAPAVDWSTRLTDVGGKVYARRVFGQLSSPSTVLNLAKTAASAAEVPIVSFKVPDNDWVSAAGGKYDTQVKSAAATLATLPVKPFLAIHHEPQGDGNAADFAAMQRHLLPIIKAAGCGAGVIVNGFWWNTGNSGSTDAEIAAWLPSDVLDLCDVVAADFYQSSPMGEPSGSKMANMGKWATRVGVKQLGVGEYNGYTASAIKSGGDAALADPRFVFACVWNSDATGVPEFVLSGASLVAFKATLAASAPVQPTPLEAFVAAAKEWNAHYHTVGFNATFATALNTYLDSFRT